MIQHRRQIPRVPKDEFHDRSIQIAKKIIGIEKVCKFKTINNNAIKITIIYEVGDFVTIIEREVMGFWFLSWRSQAFRLLLLFHILSLSFSQNNLVRVLIRGALWRIALGCFMLATLVYTIITDGSPFRSELLTPWLSATLVDFYVNVVAIAVWVAYKESSWLSTCFWVILLVCFGSISTCAYIVKQLFSISGQDSSQDPLQLVLLRYSAIVSSYWIWLPTAKQLQTNVVLVN
ncbi:hypothetical protein MA16_Dca025683 [Dendrobium catenatum]|uniref:Uncharacterized protein n=1 Tax=Dendrobium catenatum TaxID=906689 RepID=A0A2I0VCS7_9ASPA|nr:hypothetical protein MA16_Dca025683 [Dendrobium catenatum]